MGIPFQQVCLLGKLTKTKVIEGTGEDKRCQNVGDTQIPNGRGKGERERKAKFISDRHHQTRRFRYRQSCLKYGE